ncbi:GerMN domain-containing protein [Streptomyces sp. NPDC001108]
MRTRRAVAAAVLGAAALTGCGVQPTGVVTAGEPASGLTRGVRLYFASPSGLTAVPLIDRRVDDLNGALKLLGATEPPPGQGLVSLVRLGGYSATGSGERVTVRTEGPYGGSGRDQATGQLVCTLARAQSVLDPMVRADDVRVTFRPTEGEPLGPLGCAEFLGR